MKGTPTDFLLSSYNEPYKKHPTLDSVTVIFGETLTLSLQHLLASMSSNCYRHIWISQTRQKKCDRSVSIVCRKDSSSSIVDIGLPGGHLAHRNDDKSAHFLPNFLFWQPSDHLLAISDTEHNVGSCKILPNWSLLVLVTIDVLMFPRHILQIFFLALNHHHDKLWLFWVGGFWLYKMSLQPHPLLLLLFFTLLFLSGSLPECSCPRNSRVPCLFLSTYHYTDPPFSGCFRSTNSFLNQDQDP